MLISTLLAAASVLTAADALPGFEKLKMEKRHNSNSIRILPERDLGVFGNWAPAGPTDSRCPCPGINSLANHGFIPHSGRGVSLANLIIASAVYLGIGPSITATVGPFAVIASPQMDGTIDLNGLNQHGYIEHDVSTWHNDYNLGNNHIPNATKFDHMISLMPQGTKNLDFGTVSKAHYARLLEAQGGNPSLSYGPVPLFFTYLECGLMMSVTGGVLANPPVEWARSFVVDERLPKHLGWSPHLMQDIETIGAQGLLMMAMSPNLINEAMIFGETTIKSILDLSIVTNILGGVGGSEQTYNQGAGNIQPDGSVSTGATTTLASGGGLLGPLLGGLGGMLGGGATASPSSGASTAPAAGSGGAGILGGLVGAIGDAAKTLGGGMLGKRAATPNLPGGLGGLLTTILANGGQVPKGSCSGPGACTSHLAGLMNNGKGVTLDQAHIAKMWAVPDTFTYEGGNDANLAAVRAALAIMNPVAAVAAPSKSGASPTSTTSSSATATPSASASPKQGIFGQFGSWVSGSISSAAGAIGNAFGFKQS
ncbi:hypothetical protein RQP46_008676 [Phenoliferia psychrophenolica]